MKNAVIRASSIGVREDWDGRPPSASSRLMERSVANSGAARGSLLRRKRSGRGQLPDVEREQLPEEARGELVLVTYGYGRFRARSFVNLQSVGASVGASSPASSGTSSPASASASSLRPPS